MMTTSAHRQQGVAALVMGALLLHNAGAEPPDQGTGTAPGGAPDIIVSATPLPTEAEQLGRAVEVLGTNDIRRSRSASLPELLETHTSLAVSERGASGVQADLSIRSSTFQQVLTTFDGLPLADQQTAHHNMDLPFPLGALGQISVVPGPGSALFGPAAFAGVVDLAPRRPSSSATELGSASGTFGTRRAEAIADVVKDRSATTVAASYERSDGFQDGTDYETWSAWASTFLDTDSGALRVSVGHTDKDFGAQDFYASFPSRERTKTTLVDFAPEFEVAPDWLLKAIVRYRRHEDEFILIEDNPSFYRNEHITDTFIERVTLTSPDYTLGRTAVGIERSDSALDSSNLGDRSASVNSVFVQHRLPGEEYTADVGLRVDDHNDWGMEVSPSVSVSVPLSDSLAWRMSAGRGIRPPSFTELYYSDPANTGNAALEPEDAWGGEAGFDVRFGRDTRASLTYFLRDTENLIDWVRSSALDPWQARNVGEATFQGGEAVLTTTALLCDWEAAYRYTDVAADSAGMQSKYALNVARHDARVTLALPDTRGFSASVTARYQDVPTLDRYWLVTARLAQQIGDITVFFKGRNLLDEDYQEIPGVPTAGRYVEAGIEVPL